MKTFNEFVNIAEKVSQSPRPTVLPRSRERNIGRHDDWRDPHPDTRDFGERTPAAKKLKSRLNAVVGTQRRQDTETGVTNEDLEVRRQQLARRQKDNVAAFKERSLAAANAHKQKIAAKKEREQLKREIKQELQTEQHPTMEPNEYNTQVSKQQASWKGRQIRQSHGEMQSKAQSELSAKKARMKAIMSR